jgi:hypothetical protein
LTRRCPHRLLACISLSRPAKSRTIPDRYLSGNRAVLSDRVFSAGLVQRLDSTSPNDGDDQHPDSASVFADRPDDTHAEQLADGGCYRDGGGDRHGSGYAERSRNLYRGTDPQSSPDVYGSSGSNPDAGPADGGADRTSSAADAHTGPGAPDGPARADRCALGANGSHDLTRPHSARGSGRGRARCSSGRSGVA